MQNKKIVIASNLTDIDKYKSMNMEQVCRILEKSENIILKANIHNLIRTEHKSIIAAEHLYIITAGNIAIFIDKEKPPKIITSDSKTKDKKLREDIVKMMTEMGMQIGTKGFNYLLDAIVVSISNDDTKIDNTKINIYKVIANANNTTAKSVERAIGRALRSPCINYDSNEFAELFGSINKLKKNKLLPADAISILTEKARRYL